ncbi:hypothetical protein B296_00000340 [Ensete ventricosum]|uniref:Rx N-terminal domain-containing protein n=1 Tax=Ensete ventricosum TaxID=4639 RepID=A0A427B2Q8_ENSVE|nr:hypothetical protein B296_00000340 [Ensete ventricosum]
MRSAWDLSLMLRLLAQAEGQTRQLEANLGDASAAELCRPLAQQIRSALEEAVSIAKLMDSEGQQQPAWPGNAAVDLPRWNSEGLRSENSETVLKEHERREMCKKRCTYYIELFLRQNLCETRLPYWIAGELYPNGRSKFRSPAAKRAEHQKTAITGGNTARRRSLEPGTEG